MICKYYNLNQPYTFLILHQNMKIDFKKNFAIIKKTFLQTPILYKIPYKINRVIIYLLKNNNNGRIN